MANAMPELKGLADEITDSNDRDGVAIVLKRLTYPPPSLERDPIR